MLTLNLDIAPRWITVLPGVDLLVRPMHNGIWLAATEVATESATESATEAGRADVIGQPAPFDAHDWTFILGVEVAKRTVIDWRGVGDTEGTPIPVSPDAILALLHMRGPFDAFFEQVIGPWMGIVDEKKDLAPLSDGTLARAPDIAEAAPVSAPNARAASTRRKAPKA
jgi:hypothetical protein